MFTLKLIILKTRVNTTQWIFPEKRKGALDKHSLCHLLLCLQVNAVVVCALHISVSFSLSLVYTLCTWFFRSKQKRTAAQRIWTHKWPTKVNTTRHTLSKQRLYWIFCFEKLKKNIFCHRYAQSEAQRLCQGQVGEISISSQQTGCYCATLCEYVYCMDRYTEPFSWWFAEIYKDDIWWSKSLISQKCMQLIEINSIFLFLCIWKNKVKLELNGYL